MLKVLLIVAVLLFLCARMLPRLGERLGHGARKPYRQAKWMWSWLAGTEEEAIAAEHDYGQECAQEFLAQFPGRAPAAMQALVAEIGSRLAEAQKAPRRQFRFTVLASPVTNAYALPGGFVFVTQPLLDLCECDRQEIAFFLAHEMAHIIRGHAREQLTTKVFLDAVTARVAGAGGMLRDFLGRGYSRELELEADREGARLARAAGFDGRAAIRGLGRLAALYPDGPGLAEYFASHPPFADRLRELQRHVG